jgi:hypothetical protein
MPNSPKAFGGLTRNFRLLPFLVSFIALATSIPLAWDKDTGAFLIAFLIYLPAVLALCIGLCIWAVIEWRSPIGISVCRTLIALLVLIPSTFYIIPRIKDDVSFFVWSKGHHNVLNEFANRDAIILDWESWGFAGWENDSYLVSNPDDNLGEASAAPKWLQHVGSGCEIVDTNRMAHGFYIVTTYNCPLR